MRSSDDESAKDTTPGPRVFPVVIRMCEEIGSVFVKFSDASAEYVVAETYKQWVRAGEVGPRAVNRFIWMLSRKIEDTDTRVQFVKEARKCIHL